MAENDENTETKRPDYLRSINRLLIVVVIVAGIFTLIAARDLIVPFIVSLALFFVLINFENIITIAIKKTLMLLGKKEFSEHLNSTIRGVSIILSLTISIFTLFFTYKIITNNFDDMISNAVKYQALFSKRIHDFNDAVTLAHKQDAENVMLSPFQMMVTTIPESHLPVIDATIMKNINFGKMFNLVGDFTRKSVTNSMLVFIYLLFLYFERVNFRKKMIKIHEISPNLEKWDKVIRNLGEDIVGYFNIKLIVSFITAVLCSFVMAAFKLDFVWLWAFIIFVLNFIPTIGSIVATLLPVLLGLVIFDNVIDAVFMAIFITAIQFTIGSVIEPKFQGERLNLSPLMILLSLAVWGAIWGIVGMFLAVPIMVTINAALSQFETTKPLAMFFSSNGDIRD